MVEARSTISVPLYIVIPLPVSGCSAVDGLPTTPTPEPTRYGLPILLHL